MMSSLFIFEEFQAFSLLRRVTLYLTLQHTRIRAGTKVPHWDWRMSTMCITGFELRGPRRASPLQQLYRQL